MKATLNLQRGLVQTSILGLFLVSTALTGCGTDLSTSPAMTTIQADDDIGTIRDNPRRGGVPAPQGAVAELIAANTVQLRWVAQPGTLTALVTLNGREIGRVSASEGSFLDTSLKAAGGHTYELCFVRGKAVGHPAYLMIDISGGSQGDEGRGDTGDDVHGE